ncbi:hypothetical protein FC40_GL000588 [Ligilactobacillus hayakitensis DSM 18933 = JCM 14209]|uniref:Regulator of the mannose operon, ManO n=1 Tax=Ligilactobacillus hayakitensis DSM 18933 = JCM 14209 TaxID=1423755 RepID=A0A0R1WUU1_9LACO|nr:DUF956 family protein [Ligilactobacillus hayakitensis]KRM18803.1 hypothetical protein FC40_GL000588 [Ligilactobacillus hayakitensis DSM 18933 = JCM 14209]
MVESLNSKVELVTKATSYFRMAEYGKIMLGDKGFEFYNEKDVNKFIQIPWEEIDIVIASVMFRGKWIPRFAVRTKNSGTYTFSSQNTKKTLRVIRDHLSNEQVVRSLSFFQVLTRNVKNIFNHSK